MKNRLFRFRNLFSKDDDEIKAIPDGPVGFEDAVAATKFGKFNLMLMGFCVLSAHAFIFDTTVMPYVIPSAECDLQISLLDKGALNAMAHVGMICSSPLVGYLADTIGRKKVLFWGLFLDAVCNILMTFSHSFSYTVVLKFLAGFFVGGTNTMLVSMMAEFHQEKFRPTIVMFVGLGFSMAMLVVPVLALLILTHSYDVRFIGNYDFHSWQTFMGVCSLPATLAAILAIFIPESPRFLMSRDQLPEALAILRKMYSINTGLPEDTYPVKELKSSQDYSKDNKAANSSHITVSEALNDIIRQEQKPKEGTLASIRGGLTQLKPLFHFPYLKTILIMFVVHVSGVTGCNSLRLWLPQLFKMMSEFEPGSTLCEMISLGNTTVVDAPIPEDGVCEPIQIKVESFVNSIIVAAVQVFICALASVFISKIGKRRLLISSFAIGAACTLGLYWCTDSIQAVALASISVSFTAVCQSTVLSISVDLFPTALRAMAVSLILMVARIGSIIGSITFPALLASGCLPPFLTLACILFGGGFIALFIPPAIQQM